MSSFDITIAAGAGYKLVWAERSYLIKLAAAPFLIKLVCFMVVLLLGWETNFIRQALVMLPSYFADGWLFSHLVRLVFLDQRWPFRPTGNTGKDMQILQDRALGIMRGMLSFVVIRFLMAGVTAVLYGYSQVAHIEDAQDGGVSLLMFVIALASLISFFWAFRLLWLYIPAAVNYPLRWFMRDLGGYFTSWHLIGLWLFCFVPPFFTFGLVFSVLSAAAGDPEGATGIIFVANLLRVLLDTLVGVLSTACIAYGIKKYILPSADNEA